MPKSTEWSHEGHRVTLDPVNGALFITCETTMMAGTANEAIHRRNIALGRLVIFTGTPRQEAERQLRAWLAAFEDSALVDAAVQTFREVFESLPEPPMPPSPEPQPQGPPN